MTGHLHACWARGDAPLSHLTVAMCSVGAVYSGCGSLACCPVRFARWGERKSHRKCRTQLAFLSAKSTPGYPGIAFAGFNVVDLPALRVTWHSVLTVLRRRPNSPVPRFARKPVSANGTARRANRSEAVAWALCAVHCLSTVDTQAMLERVHKWKKLPDRCVPHT
jgi:hypothetical protein